MTEIRLVRVGEPDPDILEFLSLTLPEHLSVPCRLSDEAVPVRGTFNTVRGQFHSTQLLARLAGMPAGDGARILGVAEVDLFIPILTFVFGEAQLEGRAALLSTCRLRQEFYGLPPDPELFLDRVEKEALHELGHTFGLVHCREIDCVMHFSNAVEEVDLKTNEFCPDCRTRAGLRG